MRLHLSICLVLATLVCESRRASADAIPVVIAPRGSHAVVVDGRVGDWHVIEPLVSVDDLAQIVRGPAAWTGPGDAAFSFALASDEQLLYVVAEVHDDQIVRTRAHGVNEDALVVTIATSGTPHPASEIMIFPGLTGQFPGRVRFGGARSAAIVGALVSETALADGTGYTIEATIPWRTLRGLTATMPGLRARVAYQDADRGAQPTIETVIASGPGDAQHPTELPLIAAFGAQGTDAMMRNFAEAYRIDLSEALLDRPENVAGDAALERVLVLPGYVLAAGPGLAGGHRYTFIEHPAHDRADVLESTLRDVSGDGREDVILRLLVTEGNHSREFLYVYGAPEGASHLRRIFAQELAYTEGARGITNRATFEPNGGGIRITLNSATGYTAANHPRNTESGTLPPLAPWGPNRLTVYRWADASHSFEPTRVEPNGANAIASASPSMTEAPTSVEAVLRNFRRQRHIAEDATPTFTAEGNLSGDRVPETVQIYGRYLVAVGANFMNGRSSFSVELPVDNDADVLGMQLGDVTDDGHEDALVRVRRSSQSSVRGRQLEVQREYLMVYSLDESHRGRIFAAETVRRVGADSITNVVRTIPRTRNGAIIIQSGSTVGGWNADTYPFHDVPMAGFEPLLLPWGAARQVTYRWNGTALVSQP